MYYIQEADKPNLICKLFKIICISEDKIIMPIDSKTILSDKKAQKLAEKTKKLLNKAMCKKIILSEEMQKQETYVNLLHSYSFDIIGGKWLFEVLAGKVLDYIMGQKQMKKEETSISILINNISENMLANLKQIVSEYKNVNIITNHIEKFKKIEKEILEEDGIMITVGNNKRKGLCKSKIILNVDFPTELINLYGIGEDAIIVNLKEDVRIRKKRFNGISINDYEITFRGWEDLDDDKKTKYKAYKIYEASINNRQPFTETIKRLEKDKVRITKLFGVNSVV